MKKLIIITTLFLSLTNFTQAQDKIYIKGIRAIKGKVTLYEPGKLLVYTNKLGEEIRYEEDRIEKVQEVTIRNRQLSTNKYLWHLQTGLGFGSDFGLYAHPEFRFSSSYKITDRLYAGLGTGFDFYDDYHVLPIYLNSTLFLSERIKAPYVNMKFGHGNAIRRNNPWREFENIKGGFFSELEFGARIQRRRTFFTWGIGFKIQNSSSRREWNDWWFNGIRITEESQTFRRLTFRFGIGI